MKKIAVTLLFVFSFSSFNFVQMFSESPRTPLETSIDVVYDKNNNFQAEHIDSSSQLEATIKAAMKKYKEDIGQINVLDVSPIKNRYFTTVGFFVLAQGLCGFSDGTYGGYGSEIFSLFEFDNSLNEVIKIWDVFPSPSLYNYKMWIKEVNRDSVIIAGESLTDRDMPIQKSYNYKINFLKKEDFLVIGVISKDSIIIPVGRVLGNKMEQSQEHRDSWGEYEEMISE